MTVEEAYAFIRSPQGLAAARDYLSAALRLDAMIALRLSRLDAARARGERVTRALDALAGGGGAGDRVGEAAADLADQEAALLADYHALLKQQKEIGAAIARVPEDRQRMVLEMRYLQGLPFFRIAMTLHYDERQVYRLHERGLRHVAAQIALGEIAPAAEAGEQESPAVFPG